MGKRYLEERIREGILGLTLVGVTAITGCETAQDTAIFSGLTGLNAALASSPQEAAVYSAVSQSSGIISVIQGQREAAESGRHHPLPDSSPSIAPYQLDPSINQTPAINRHSERSSSDIWLTYWVDINGNGKIDPTSVDYISINMELCQPYSARGLIKIKANPNIYLGRKIIIKI